ncbi:MAG: response regulator [Acidobacteriota bacterium]|nr:response regulator [Acidobacteriota bacterium]
MRFLIVDDSSTMRRILVNTLRKLGYPDCLEAASGAEAIACLADTPVDMVITDCNMPEMDGLAFVRAVRANEATRDLPVVMVTANAADADLLDARTAGITSYVVKPFTTQALDAKIRESLPAV